MVNQRLPNGSIVSTLTFLFETITGSGVHPLGKKQVSMRANFEGGIGIQCYSTYIAVSYVTRDDCYLYHHVDIIDWKQAKIITVSAQQSICEK